MSDTDSFIDEVTEEVRKDRTYAFLRKWWWVAALLVAVIVGGTVYSEYTTSQGEQKAQAFGDALLAASEADQPVDTNVASDPAQQILAGLLNSSTALTNEDPDAALAALEQAGQVVDAPAVYRDLVALKSALLMDNGADAEAKIASLDAISGPGAPFRVLAQEQKAIVLASTGATDDAIAILRSLLVDADASAGLQQRATQLIVALGGNLNEG